MKENGKILYWAPRVLAILFIAFLSLFSLDVFEAGQGLGEMLLGFLIHNIPSIIISLLLIVAWRNDLFGAIAFSVVGLAFIILLLVNTKEVGETWLMVLIRSLPITGFALVVALLFFLNWQKRRQS